MKYIYIYIGNKLRDKTYDLDTVLTLHVNV